jgi:hypothetical protein
VSLTSGAFGSSGYPLYTFGVGLSPVGTFDVGVAVSRQARSEARSAVLTFTAYPGKAAPHSVYPQVTAGVLTEAQSASRGLLFGMGFHGWLVRSPLLQVIPQVSAGFSMALAGLGNKGSPVTSRATFSAGVSLHVAFQPTSHLILDLEPGCTHAESQSQPLTLVGAQLSLVLR